MVKGDVSVKKGFITGLVFLGVIVIAIAAIVIIQDDPKAIQPLQPPAWPVKVAIVKDDNLNIPQMVQNVVTQSLGAEGIGAIVKTGNTVFIHPNVVYVSSPKDHIITDYRIVQALVDLVKAAGAGKIIIGEGTSTGNTDSAMMMGGYTTQNFPGCELVDLNDTTLPRYEVNLVEGFNTGVSAKKRILKAFIDADVVIGISKLKTHICAGYTGATKLSFGIPAYPIYVLAPFSKDYQFKWHLHDFLHQNIVDINLCRVPDFSIIDALMGQEGQGPGSGTPKILNSVIASRDPVAADAVGCEIMGIPAFRITHLVLAASMNVGILDMSKIEVAGTPIASVKSPFIRALPYKYYGYNNYCATAALRPRPANVPAVIIDGNLSEFANAEIMNANMDEQVVMDAMDWGGPSDLSFAAKIMYDSVNMYIGVTVLDSAKKLNTDTGSAIENGSSIEVYISSKKQRFVPGVWNDTAAWEDTTFKAQRDYRIGFSYAATPAVYVYSNPTQTIAGLEVKKVDTDGGYNMEIKLPLSIFPSYVPEKYREFGLNVVAVKAGGNGPRKIAWEPNPIMEENSLEMGAGYFFPAASSSGIQFKHSSAPEFLKAKRPSLSVTPSSFSGSAKLSFTVPDYRKAGRHIGAEVSIFTINGKKATTLMNKRVLPGKYELQWNGNDAAGRRLGAGNYICKLLITGERGTSAKVAIVR